MTSKMRHRDEDEDVGWEQKRQEDAAELVKERKRNKVQDAEMAMWMSFCRNGKITILG